MNRVYFLRANLTFKVRLTKVKNVCVKASLGKNQDGSDSAEQVVFSFVSKKCFLALFKISWTTIADRLSSPLASSFAAADATAAEKMFLEARANLIFSLKAYDKRRQDKKIFFLSLLSHVAMKSTSN